MQHQWNGCLIFSEAVSDDAYEAWLEHDEDGFIGNGTTDAEARADLIDQLRADNLERADQAEMAADDMAHARRSAQWEARL